MIYSATEQYIDLAKDSIENGGIIVYPTDTLYGFGADATNSEAIGRLNRMKGRLQPLSIILSSITQISSYAKIKQSIRDEINTLLPGPYTVLLPSIKSNLSPLVQNGSTKVGIRIPNHFFPIQLVKLLNKPIITTSINKHGKKPLNDIISIELNFPNIDIFEDSNNIVSKGSTIIDYSSSIPKIIRIGDGVYPL